jgi:hypothetical protein
VTGNGAQGVFVGGGTNNTIQGNRIGTNPTGTAAVPNQFGGIYLGSQPSSSTVSGNVISGNVISGNASNGIYLDTGATGTAIANNKIGTNEAATAPLGNAGNGITLSGSTSTTIGGTTASMGNVISANTGSGIFGTSSGLITIQGNWIGTNPALAAGLGNAYGINLHASDGLVGGIAAGAQNVISYNGIGVQVDSAGDAIVSNSIFGNQSAGILLTGGALGLINPPDISSVEDEITQTTATGTVTVPIPGTYTLYLQFFANATCEHPPVGEGRTLLTTFTVVTDNFGVGSFVAVLPAGLVGSEITATTSTSLGYPTGTSSGFSDCKNVTPF